MRFGRGARKRPLAAHTMAAPEGVENLVEPLPIGARRAEQRSQRRFSVVGRAANGKREDRKRIARLRKPTLKPLSRSVRANEASLSRIGLPTSRTVG